MLRFLPFLRTDTDPYRKSVMDYFAAKRKILSVCGKKLYNKIRRRSHEVELLFYRCKKCGNFVMFVGKKSGCTPFCCSQEMALLTPNTTDAATEKHVPEVVVEGDKVTVQVGSTLHPMTEEHLIQFIYLQTEDGGQIRYLKAGDEPKAAFALNGEKPLAVYEYCNLHGLWKKDI